ncbi:hypothetical protein [Streptomyces prunicolor]|uniref:hypothetical protein n=1 Tax=Streptomyces prunicolor TaxID=67348 RepID=UPI0033F895A5
MITDSPGRTPQPDRRRTGRDRAGEVDHDVEDVLYEALLSGDGAVAPWRTSAG